LEEGFPLRRFDSDWLLGEVVVAPCCQSPQARPEGTKRTVHGIRPRELFVFQQHKEIPTSEQRFQFSSDFAEPLASLRHCSAHYVRSYPVTGGLRLSGAAFAGKVAQVIFVAFRSSLIGTQFVNGKEGVKDITKRLAGDRIWRSAGKSFKTLLDEVSNGGPLCTRQNMLCFSLASDLDKRLRWIHEHVNYFETIFACRFEELLGNL
jgi:hypothetical protein